MDMKLSGAALLAVLLATTSCGGHKAKTTDDAELTVDVALPLTDSITLRNTYPGQLSSTSVVSVVGRVSGQLLSQNFTSGQFVRKGEVLFTIEDTKYRDAVQQASAELTTAISARDYAKSHYAAVKKALESDAVSKMEVNQAESTLNQAEASIKNAQAALATARTNLSYCRIIAPISGMISSPSLDVGNYINGEAAAVPLATIYDTSDLYATFSIDNGDNMISGTADNSKKNQPLFSHIPLIFSDSISHDYYGDLSYVSPTIEATTGTLELRCTIKNTYDELRPGMFVKVDLPYGQLDKAILVKDASISTDQLGKYLYVVNDSNKIVYTPIKTGPIYHDSLRVVYDGLTPESKYVTSALLKVKNGMEVKPRLIK